VRAGGLIEAVRGLAVVLARTLGLIWAAAPGWTAAWAMLLLAQGLLPISIVALTQPLVDGIAAVVAAGGDSATIRPLLPPAALMGAAMLGMSLIQSLLTWVREIQGELVRLAISGLVHRQSASVDYAFYESPDYYDQLHRARDEASSRPVELLESLGGCAQNAITTVGMLFILLPSIRPAGERSASLLRGVPLESGVSPVVGGDDGGATPNLLLRLDADRWAPGRGATPI
jgi:hypothetical protein